MARVPSAAAAPWTNPGDPTMVCPLPADDISDYSHAVDESEDDPFKNTENTRTRGLEREDDVGVSRSASRSLERRGSERSLERRGSDRDLGGRGMERRSSHKELRRSDHGGER